MGIKTPCLGAQLGSLKTPRNLGASGDRAPVRQQPCKRGYPNDRLTEKKCINFKKYISRLETILVPLKMVLAYPWDPSYEEEEEEIHIDQMAHHL